MKSEQEVEICNKYGFHVRPSTLFAQAAKQFESSIKVNASNGANADGKNIMMLMTLGAVCGARIRISADGEDADQAVTALVDLVQNRFGGIE